MRSLRYLLKRGSVLRLFVYSGTVFCFNVGVPKDMQKLAKQLDVKIHSGKVIYRLLHTLKVSHFY